MLNASYIGNNRLKRLKDFKTTERIPRPAVKVFPIQFGDDEETRRIVLHHARRGFFSIKKKYRSWLINESRIFTLFLAYQNFKIFYDQSAFTKNHPITPSKSYFLIWTKLKILSIKKHVHMDKMDNEVKQGNSIT